MAVPTSAAVPAIAGRASAKHPMPLDMPKRRTFAGSTSSPNVIATKRTVTAAPSLAAASTLGEPAGYYASAQGKQGADLLHSLHETIRQGHTDSGYAQARDAMFGIVDDRADNNQVADIYTGRVISNVGDRKEAYDRGLNAEHTWPQSKGATGIAQSDLHQLQPSIIDINGKRGNLPYGEVKTVEQRFGESPDASELGTDANGATVFEPRDSVKGDIARGLLYFYTRYNASRTSDFTLENLRQEMPTLLQWNQADPVDAVERTRHERVWNFQHNRNPYIDHPEWVTAVDFPAAISRDAH